MFSAYVPHCGLTVYSTALALRVVLPCYSHYYVITLPIIIGQFFKEVYREKTRYALDESKSHSHNSLFLCTIYSDWTHWSFFRYSRCDFTIFFMQRTSTYIQTGVFSFFPPSFHEFFHAAGVHACLFIFVSKHHANELKVKSRCHFLFLFLFKV